MEKYIIYYNFLTMTSYINKENYNNYKKISKDFYRSIIF